MPKRLVYKLKIDAYSPDTIPMSRLAEYLSDLAGLLGEVSSVHFIELEEGSTVVNVAVDQEAIPKVSDRVAAFQRGEVFDDLQKHFEALDRRLVQDNGTGILRAYMDDDQIGSVVIQFPGCERPKPIDYGVVRENGTLDGIPVSIGGRDKSSHIILQDGAKSYTGINVSRELAIKLSDQNCLYRKTVRLRGVGRWHRNTEGNWELKKFVAEDFEILGDAPLSETLEQLRSVAGSGWAETDDPIGFLRDLRTDRNERPH